jgi:hypothetical protein
MIKALKKLRIEGSYLNIIKSINDKPIANIMLNEEKLKAFPIRPEMEKGYIVSPLLFNVVLELLTREKDKRKK